MSVAKNTQVTRAGGCERRCISPEHYFTSPPRVRF